MFIYGFVCTHQITVKILLSIFLSEQKRFPYIMISKNWEKPISLFRERRLNLFAFSTDTKQWSGLHDNHLRFLVLKCCFEHRIRLLYLLTRLSTNIGCESLLFPHLHRGNGAVTQTVSHDNHIHCVFRLPLNLNHTFVATLNQIFILHRHIGKCPGCTKNQRHQNHKKDGVFKSLCFCHTFKILHKSNPPVDIPHHMRQIK